jgi:hypothetical protein
MVRDFLSVYGLLLAISAAAIAVDPARAPFFLIVVFAGAIGPWRRAWTVARGTALRPALVWAAVALALAGAAQAAACFEAIDDGRPATGHLTYLMVVALLAALVSVLNARTPGERVWALLMIVLVLVFLVPWLEDQTRLRRAQGLTRLHLDAPWTLFYGLLVVVTVTNYLPTRFGSAAVALGVMFFLEYLGLTRPGVPARRLASIWMWVAWTLAASVGLARLSADRAPPAHGGCEQIWFWFRDHWGLVWALRTKDRFNREAELARWPVRLTWFGLGPATGVASDPPPPAPAEAESALRGLVRRFAQSWRLDEVSHSA